jgi:hypothetical protein
MFALIMAASASLPINIFIGCYLLFALFWDSPEINLVHKALRSRAAFLIRIAGLTHSWNMYKGPFLTITRLETRVRYADNTIEVFAPPKRYEFRRYYFMIGVRTSVALYNRHLRWVQLRLRDDPRKIEEIQIVRQGWKAPVRRGGVRGRFEVAAQQQCREAVVALWTRT